MKKQIATMAILVLVFTALALPALAGGDSMGKEEFTKLAIETFLTRCGFSEEEFDQFYLGEVFKTEGPNGRQAARADFTYIDTYYLGGEEPWVIDLVTYGLIMTLDDGEIYEEDDPQDFAQAVASMKQRQIAMRALEEAEKAHGDFLDWPEEMQLAYVQEYAGSFDVRKGDWHSNYPSPEGLHLWDAARIGQQALEERFGVTAEQLQKLEKDIGYTYPIGEMSIDDTIFLHYSTPIGQEGPSYAVSIDIKTGTVNYANEYGRMVD